MTVTIKPEQLRELFSERYEGQLEGSAAREFDESLLQDPELRQEYEQFAEVIKLINVLPKPTSDPDFLSKVHRRIHRRQRSRRRSRRQQPTLPLMGTLSTLIALVFVAIVGFLGRPVTQVSNLSPVVAPNAAPPVLLASVELDLEATQALLQQAMARRLLVNLGEDETAQLVQVRPNDLAPLLEWLGTQTAVRLGNNTTQDPGTIVRIILTADKSE